MGRLSTLNRYPLLATPFVSGNVVKRAIIVTTSPASLDDYSSHNPRDDNKVMSLFNYSGEQFGDSASCCLCKRYNT